MCHCSATKQTSTLPKMHHAPQHHPQTQLPAINTTHTSIYYIQYMTMTYIPVNGSYVACPEERCYYKKYLK